MSDLDPSIIGRRSGDGTWISFREAVKMFATKEEVANMALGINAIANQVRDLPSRAEHKVRWDVEDEYRKNLRADIEGLKSGRVPERVITIGGIIVAVLIAVFGHH